MDPHVLLRMYDAAPPVRWEATLLGGGWRGHADDDLLPAAGLVIDAGLQGAVELEGARWLAWDRRRVRGALTDPAGTDDAAVALTLLLRATGVLRQAAGMAPSGRTLRRLEARRTALPAVAAAVLEALDARRRRLELIGT
jgi:hypothetical protein